MSGTSSAAPADLRHYGVVAGEVGDAMRRDAGVLGRTLDRFRASGTDHMPAVPALDDRLNRLGATATTLAERTSRIGDAFAAAGGEGQIVTVDDQAVAVELEDDGDGDWFAPIEWVIDRVRDVVGFVNDLEEAVGEAFRWAHDKVLEIRDEIRVRVRAFRARLARVGHIAVRTIEVTWRRIYDWVLEPAVWRQRIGRWLGQLARVTRPLGRVLGPIAHVLTGRERWLRDADRPDTTSTERVLRAGTEILVRGVPQVLLGKVVISLTALTLKTGPFAIILAPLVVAAGIGVSIALDRAMSWVANKLLDEWQWSQDAIRWAADRIDDVGGWFRDVGQAVWAAGGQALEWIVDTGADLAQRVADGWSTLTDTVSGAWDSVTDAVSSGWTTVTDTVSGAWDTVTDTVSGGWQRALDTYTDSWRVVTEGVSGAAGTVVDTVSGGVATVTDTISDGVATVTDTISHGAGVVTDTVAAGAGAATDTVSGAVGTVTDNREQRGERTPQRGWRPVRQVTAAMEWQVHTGQVVRVPLPAGWAVRETDDGAAVYLTPEADVKGPRPMVTVTVEPLDEPVELRDYVAAQLAASEQMLTDLQVVDLADTTVAGLPAVRMLSLHRFGAFTLASDAVWGLGEGRVVAVAGTTDALERRQLEEIVDRVVAGLTLDVTDG